MLDSFAQFFLNKAVKISSKFLTFMFIILCVLIFDNVTGFSFYKNNSEKISQLKLISDLRQKNHLSEESNILLSEIERNINNRNSITDRMQAVINSIVQTKFVKKNISDNGIVFRNNLKLFFFTNWILLLFAIAIPIPLLTSVLEEGYGFKYRIFSLISTWVIIFLISIVCYFLVEKIPMIGNNWNINYILSFLLQPFIVFVFFKLTGASVEKS